MHHEANETASNFLLLFLGFSINPKIFGKKDEVSHHLGNLAKNPSFSPHNNWPSENNTYKENPILKTINFFDDNIFNAFIIFFVLLMINLSIIVLLKWAEYGRMKMTTQVLLIIKFFKSESRRFQNVKDRKTSIMLLAVLLAYVLTHSPSMIIEYFDKPLVNGLHKDVSFATKTLRILSITG